MTSRTEFGVDDDEFTRLWNASSGLDDCHDRLTGLAQTRSAPPVPKLVILARVADLRARGAALKPYLPGPRQGSKDIDEMSRHIAERMVFAGKSSS